MSFTGQAKEQRHQRDETNHEQREQAGNQVANEAAWGHSVDPFRLVGFFAADFVGRPRFFVSGVVSAGAAPRAFLPATVMADRFLAISYCDGRFCRFAVTCDGITDSHWLPRVMMTSRQSHWRCVQGKRACCIAFSRIASATATRCDAASCSAAAVVSTLSRDCHSYF